MQNNLIWVFSITNSNIVLLKYFLYSNQIDLCLRWNMTWKCSLREIQPTALFVKCNSGCGHFRCLVWAKIDWNIHSLACFYEPSRFSWCLARRLSLFDSCYSEHTTRCSMRANLSDIHSLTTKVSNALTCFLFSLLHVCTFCSVREGRWYIESTVLYFFT